jgi:DNA primase
MAFPPQFLDELRSRVGLADLIGRRVKLTRKGREHSGLCPFHSEKTPSFTVSEEKGFYHCFGCGVHGDIIGFIMQIDNVSFPEAVERLADEAGIPVPQMSPEEQRVAKRQATLYQVMEQAAEFFEKSLRSAEGRVALAYLRDRGLDDDAIVKFRLGYAPESRGALKTALLGSEIDEAQLVEGGLCIRPDGGGAPYDRFRGRVMFPITDRRGRVIAFGARTLGDSGPKYLNSPETPLFHKGQVLYGLATAWPASRKEDRVVVAEGYMDVIALVRAGIGAAVAPLGTALTESQISLLWRMAPEPVLCFDGDNAGQRAAFRAAERALPLLKPGYSLRFVSLPAGEDPDTLISSRGAAAMEELIKNARPLDRVLWDMETAGQQIDTPERIAGLEQRLEQRAYAIADGKVQYQYLAAFRQRLRERTAELRGRNSGGARRGGGFESRKGWGGSKKWDNRTPPRTSKIPDAPEVLTRRREQVVLSTLINHWDLMDEFSELLGTLDFFDLTLDKLRQEILLIFAASPDLDFEGIQSHLIGAGWAMELQTLLSHDLFVHAGFAKASADRGVARLGVAELLQGFKTTVWQIELAEVRSTFEKEPTPENWTRLQECMVVAQHQGRNAMIVPDLSDNPADTDQKQMLKTN